jgi:hypothetical protein
VGFPNNPYHFLQAGWWLLVVVVVLVIAYAAQLVGGMAPFMDSRLRGGRAGGLAASIAGLSLGAGGVLFAGTLCAHGDKWWPGLIGGIALAALAQRATGPVVLRARGRLPDRAAREALSLYLDAAALLTAALVALLHPLGYVLVAALLWFAWRGRARGDDKYAGLRILRR